MLPHEDRSEVLRTLLELARQNAIIVQANLSAMDTLRQLFADHEPPADPPTKEEQEILDLFDAGTTLTGAKIATFLGDETDNGTLRNRLSTMVKKGLLLNKRPGYALPE